MFETLHTNTAKCCEGQMLQTNWMWFKALLIKWMYTQWIFPGKVEAFSFSFPLQYIFLVSATLIHAFCLAVHWLPSTSLVSTAHWCWLFFFFLLSVLIMFLYWFQFPTDAGPLGLPLKWKSKIVLIDFKGTLFPPFTLLTRSDFKMYVTLRSTYLPIKYIFF